MVREWSFGKKVAAGFAACVLLTVVLGVVAAWALNRVVASKDRVIEVNSRRLIDAQELLASFERMVAISRGYLLIGDEARLERLRGAREQFAATIEELRAGAATDEERELVGTIERDEAEHRRVLEQILALRRSGAPLETVNQRFEDELYPLRDELYRAISAFVSREERLLEETRQASTDTATRATAVALGIAAAAVLFAALVAVLLVRNLSRQVGSAVGQVQSSSAELQASANQQATGAREQSTAMSEITTTISELLATSRQIADSAQRVADIAGQTAEAARSGDGTVERAQESVSGMRQQVDLVVSHMLELGGKSQQVGAVLDIVSELAEQTNILAINATIEAAGAGEAGRRFAVVADEIRKLADRVAGSTKEVRTLIEDVRGSVHSTVMATEAGSKAVEATSRLFSEVAASFRKIGGLVATTTEAAREIGLSTKQQATAVEQVNLAVANVAQATKETEASSGQTLATASQLATLSRDLQRLVRPAAA